MRASEAKLPPLVTGPDGVIRLAGTAVSLETVVTAFDLGATAEQIVQTHPSLELAAVNAVITYVLDHRTDFDAYVARRCEDARARARAMQDACPSALKQLMTRFLVDADFKNDIVRAALSAQLT
jgi:uncharacterized protein (DUF433 family)